MPRGKGGTPSAGRRGSLDEGSLTGTLRTDNSLTIVVPETAPTITALAAEALLQILLTAAHARGVSVTRQPLPRSEEEYP
jgi:hypothetical protein